MDSDAMDTSSDEGTRLCDLCSGITAASLTSADGYRHAKNLAIVSDGQGSCTLCNQMWHQMERPGLVTGQNLVADLGEQPFKHLRLKAVPVVGSTYYSRQGHSLFVYFESDAGIMSQPLPELEVWCPVGDPATAFGISELHFGRINTRSVETFRFIEDCLGECRNHDCGEPLLPENAETTPSRLVGLGDLILSSLSANAAATQVVGSVRLVNVTRPNCPTYVALSHCWGSNLEAYKTTSTNLLQRQIGLDVQTLSPTFRDAIEICCRLQVHYIWIDALCIVQDSAEDWNTESVIMGDIYQNALFTISASHARDGLGGCFNDSCKPALDNDFTAITTSTSMGEETSILIRSKKTNYIPAQDLQESPLSKRGWVYQERFLSSRIIHFAATQVIWECRNTFRQERLHPVTTPTVPSQAKLSSSLNAEGAVFHWHQLVQDYSARGFTKYEDRLVALAGVAQICRPRINSRYLAGLWSSHLAYGLAWSRTDGNLSSPASAPRYPTWSWASQNHSVSWKGDKFDFSSDGMGFVLKSERLDLHQTARQDFGPVKGGSITIRGRAARITHINTDSLTVFGNCDIQLGDLKGDLLIDEPSNLTELSQRTPDVFALALGCWRDFRLVVVLVLVPVGVGTGTYWRVGLGNVYTEAADGATFGTGHIPETISIL